MSYLPSLKKSMVLVLLLMGMEGWCQLSQEAAGTSYGGGTTSGPTFTSEFSLGTAGGRASGVNTGFYVGFPSLNMESAVITLDVQDATNTTLQEAVNGVIFRVSRNTKYDTLDFVTSTTGNVVFNPVFIGDYLVITEADPTKYVATYLGGAFEWEEADTIQLLTDTDPLPLVLTAVPPELTSVDGEGVVSGVVEEDFIEEESTARVTARRRAAKRKCGLKRRSGSGRPDQNNNFELIAYGETNEQGEFEYGFLPVGTYRFFVEYPGIPIDESTFVEFEVGEAGVSDDQLQLAVYVDDDGISIELVLGITKDFFTAFTMYPNPTSDVLNITYDKVLSTNMTMEIINVNGQKMYGATVKKETDKTMQLDLSIYPPGQYFIQFIDHTKPEDRNKLIYRFIKN